MVYTSFTFKNVFQYDDGDIYWCTADIGWITGHSYILYGPLSNGATTIMFEGIPSFPNYSRFWQIVEKFGVNQFSTWKIFVFEHFSYFSLVGSNSKQILSKINSGRNPIVGPGVDLLKNCLGFEPASKKSLNRAKIEFSH